MPGVLQTLINGGMTFFRPLYITRGIRSWNVPEGINEHTAEPPNIPYWEEQQPLSDVSGTSVAHSNTKKPGRRERVISANFIKPEISIDRLQAADSIVSLVYGLKKLAWAHVDRTLTVRDWQQHEWSQLVKGRQHPDLYLADVSAAVSKLPPADIYILERSALSSQNASMFPVTLHLRIVEAMLYALLNPGYSAEREHRVFSIPRTTVGKHFGIMVGGAKTSGVDLVQRLVEESIRLEQPRIRFTQDVIHLYKHKLHPRGQHRNEEMCDALLQAIALHELTQKCNP